MSTLFPFHSSSPVPSHTLDYFATCLSLSPLLSSSLSFSFPLSLSSPLLSRSPPPSPVPPSLHFSPLQELEALAAKFEVEMKAVEDAAKSLRAEKDTVQQ